jgi:hypothetical protein
MRLVDGDVPVAVGVGGTGPQPFDQARREHRAGYRRAGQGIAGEGVLAGSGGRQDSPAPGVPGYPPIQVKPAVPLAAVGERAAEAAVEDHHLLAGPAFLQLLHQPPGGDAGAAQRVLHGVSGSEVKTVAPIQHAVARQVHKHHVPDAPPGQERDH